MPRLPRKFSVLIVDVILAGFGLCHFRGQILQQLRIDQIQQQGHSAYSLVAIGIVLDLREESTTSDTEQYGIAYYQSQGYTLRDDLSQTGILAVLFK